MESTSINGSDFTVPLFINGEQRSTEKTFEVVSPASGKSVHRCSSASEDDALAAVDAATTALPAWKKLSPSRRRDIFLKAADVMERRKDELAEYLTSETGGAKPWADFNLVTAIEYLKDIAGRAVTLTGTFTDTANENVSAMVLKEPYGVVLAMAPWNAPYILAVRAVAFPLAAGNTVVLRGSESSPRVMWGVVSCLHEAGLPAGVLNMIIHEPANAPAITSTLIAHPAVKKLNFTGSTAIGRIIAKQAGEHLKPAILELGGKAPAIVWEDADLELAASQCALGAFLHAGQICMSTERILVHKNIRAAFEEKLAESIKQIFPSGAEAPVLINSTAVDKNRKLLRDALDKGASLVAGDLDANVQEISSTRMRPVVIRGVTTDMDIYKTESFGPSVSLFEIETEEEALRIANDTEYGLSSAVFTEDLRRALRFARAIESGAVHINGMTVHDEPVLPHGGAKASGYGRFNASALEEWVRTKTVTFRN